jgi:hypothetical protein
MVTVMAYMMYPVEPMIMSGISRPAQMLTWWARRRAGMLEELAEFGGGAEAGEEAWWGW